MKVNFNTVRRKALQMSRRHMMIAVLVLMGALGCGREAPGTAASGPGGGTLLASIRSEPTTYNRLVAAAVADEVLRLLTHDTLVRVHRGTGALEPRLAASWSASADGRIFTLQLRPGVRFSDGTPLTAADVVFTFEALNDPKVKSEMAGSVSVAGQPISASASGDAQVTLTFPSASALGLELVAGLPILPRHKLDAALAAGTFRDAWSVKTALAEIVGLGPFVLAEHRPGERLRFTRNPHFWKKDEAGRALPYLDAIDLAVISDTNAEMLRLEAGQSDIPNDAVRADDLAAFMKAESTGRLTLIDAGVAADADGLWFNLSPNTEASRSRPWLLRTEFRRALSLAVNREEIVNAVYLSRAVPIGGPVTPGHGDWYLPDLVPRHDPAAARTLLAGLGLRDRNGDGRLDDAAGKPVSFSVLTATGNTMRERTVSLIKSHLAAVGVDVTIATLAPGAMQQKYAARDFDTIYFGFGSDTLDPSRLTNYWLSSGIFHVWNPGQSKPATAWETKIDALMKQIATTPDRGMRITMFADVQRTFASELPALYFVARRATIATSARVGGATPSVLWPPLLWNAEALFLKPSMTAKAPRP